MTREEAKAKGLKLYATGKPCKNGHVDKRRTVNASCLTCERNTNRSATARYRRRQGQAERTGRRKAALASGALMYTSNKPCKEGHFAARYSSDGACSICAAEKSRRRAAEIKQWHAANRGRVNANQARCAAKRKQRVPAWADLEAINFFYQNCPAGCEVDHIIPLNGRLASGLHVETNLQWLPAAVNNAKNNRFEPYAVSFA